MGAIDWLINLRYFVFWPKSSVQVLVQELEGLTRYLMRSSHYYLTLAEFSRCTGDLNPNSPSRCNSVCYHLLLLLCVRMSSLWCWWCYSGWWRGWEGGWYRWLWNWKGTKKILGYFFLLFLLYRKTVVFPRLLGDHWI